ncbi:MAG: ester cyclase [Hyphomicrobium sp.]|nr:ester cyclase [Hyphomicrobium sp.]
MDEPTALAGSSKDGTEVKSAGTAPRVKAMSLEAEKSLSRRSLNMWLGNNTDNPEDVFAQNYVNHQEPNAEGGVKSIDLQGWKDVVHENNRAFSDFQVKILMQIAEGDLVATR